MIKKAIGQNKGKGTGTHGIEERGRILKYIKKYNWETKQEIASDVNKIAYEGVKTIERYQIRGRPTTPNYKQ